MSNHLTPIWLVGSGHMAIEYAKVLKGLCVPYIAIGRGALSCEKFESSTGHKIISGGLQRYLSGNPEVPAQAIVVVSIEELSAVASELLSYGVRSILLEKPAGMDHKQIAAVCKLAEDRQASVFVAYNRRFFASVRKGLKIIAEDGGPVSYSFEFTEWAHQIVTLNKTPEVFNSWFLANSTHVLDTAFYLGGEPLEMQCYTAGSLEWYKPAAIFVGSGVATSGALFSYQANWKAPGRWGIEISTSKHRLIYRPMEKLQIQKIGSIAIEPVEIDDELDIQYKPGLFLQTQAFLNGEKEKMLGIEQHLHNLTIYCAIEKGEPYFRL